MSDPRWYDVLRSIEGRRLNRRRLVVSAAAAGAAATLPATLGARTVSAQIDANTLVIADETAAAFITLDPGWFYEINPAAAMNLNYEPLYTLPDSTEATEFAPLLAADFPEISEDGMTATIKLRDGVKFHSGNPMTADDVIFSWNRLKNIKWQASFMATDYWTDVEKVDDLTIKITLTSPNAALVPILSSLPLSVIDSVLLKEHGGTDAEDADQTDTGKEWIDEGNSVGTGPYKCTVWDIESEVVLEKNPDYWGEPAKLDRIIWRNIEGANQQLQAVQAGEADIAFTVDPDAVEGIKAEGVLQVISGPTLNHQYLALHTAEDVGGPLANKALRQAIGYAIDYDGIINDLLKGAAIQPATIAPEPLLGTELVADKKYTLDLAKAQELYDSAGLGDVELTLTYGAGDTADGGLDNETLVTKLQSDLQQINGLTVKLNPMDPAQRLADFRAAKLQFTTSNWSPDYPDIHTYADPFGRTDTAAARRVAFSNAAVDGGLDAGIAEADEATRAQIYADLLGIIIDEAPFLVLYQPVDQKPASAAVEGVSTHSVYMMQLRNASKSA
jgi:peptide/nickel transport system substrate-binding protein